jgi:drug/metabolite transporter superfamily protein YnfA
MNDPHHKPAFWIGNGLLVLALAILFFLGPLSEILGAWAMILWMVLAAAGIYLITKDKGPSSNMPE